MIDNEHLYYISKDLHRITSVEFLSEYDYTQCKSKAKIYEGKQYCVLNLFTQMHSINSSIMLHSKKNAVKTFSRHRISY